VPFPLCDSFWAHPDQGSPRRISGWNAGVPPLIYALPRGGCFRAADTRIHRSTSPPGAGRPGAPSDVWPARRRNPCATRATGHVNELRIIGARAQHPEQTDDPPAGHGDLRHPAVVARVLQALIGAAPLRIQPRRGRRGLDQQPAHHRVPLLTGGAPALATAGGVLAWIPSLIAHPLAAVGEALDGSHRPCAGQRHHPPHSRMGAQQRHLRTRPPGFFHRPIPLPVHHIR